MLLSSLLVILAMLVMLLYYYLHDYKPEHLMLHLWMLCVMFCSCGHRDSNRTKCTIIITILLLLHLYSLLFWFLCLNLFVLFLQGPKAIIHPPMHLSWIHGSFFVLFC